MDIYFTIIGIAVNCVRFADYLRDVAESVSGTWLLGEYLADPFYNLRGVFLDLSNSFAGLAGNWIEFYSDVLSKLELPPEILGLIDYYHKIQVFFSNPGYLVEHTLMALFPLVRDVLIDPFGFVYRAILARTGFTADFLLRPVLFINSLIVNNLGELVRLRNDPIGWLVGKLNQVIPGFARFANDPQDWLIWLLLPIMPDLRKFLSDPYGYIYQAFMLTVEKQLERDALKLAKLAERILSGLF